jgi:hypothetical protein
MAGWSNFRAELGDILLLGVEKLTKLPVFGFE